MDIKEYRRKYKDNESNAGWDSIDHALKKIYGDQEPKHWAPVIHHMLGGEDPLDGNEYEQLKIKGVDAESLFEKHKASNPLFITDLNRH